MNLAAILKFDESQHPRDKIGQFTDAGGVSLRTDRGERISSTPEGAAWVARNRVDASSHAPGSKHNPIACHDNIERAARLIAEGKHVTLNQPEQVSTLVAKIQHDYEAAKAAGHEPPTWNLAAISVKGTNLFAVDNLDIPRVKMPQLSGIPSTGTKSAARLSSENDTVDLTPEFLQSLAASGITSKEVTVQASHLRATQNELNGRNVAQIVARMDKGTSRDRKIFITRDNYVLDGHHHWGAVIVRDLRDNHPGDLTLKAIKLDIDIGTALSRARAFQEEWGIPSATLKWAWAWILKGGPGSGRYPKGSGQQESDAIIAKLISDPVRIYPVDNAKEPGFILPDGRRFGHRYETHEEAVQAVGLPSLSAVLRAGVIRWQSPGAEIHHPITEAQAETLYTNSVEGRDLSDHLYVDVYLGLSASDEKTFEEGHFTADTIRHWVNGFFEGKEIPKLVDYSLPKAARDFSHVLKGGPGSGRYPKGSGHNKTQYTDDFSMREISSEGQRFMVHPSSSKVMVGKIHEDVPEQDVKGWYSNTHVLYGSHAEEFAESQGPLGMPGKYDDYIKGWIYGPNDNGEQPDGLIDFYSKWFPSNEEAFDALVHAAEAFVTSGHATADTQVKGLEGALGYGMVGKRTLGQAFPFLFEQEHRKAARDYRWVLKGDDPMVRHLSKYEWVLNGGYLIGRSVQSIATKRQMGSGFNEALHPRDAIGQFTASAGSDVARGERTGTQRLYEQRDAIDQKIQVKARGNVHVPFAERFATPAPDLVEAYNAVQDRIADRQRSQQFLVEQEKAKWSPKQLATALEKVTGKPLESESPLKTQKVKTTHAGEVEGGVNAVVQVELEDGTKAVYKPEIGEAWTGGFANYDISRFITNRDFSLAEREAMAYEVDHALGLGIVPDTVLRESLENVDISNLRSGDDSGGGGNYHDSDELQRMYDSFREENHDYAYNAAAAEMDDLYRDAQTEHVVDTQNRVDEMSAIWDTVVEEHPEEHPYGSETQLKAHPTLPMGSVVGFNREVPTQEVDPLEVLKEAKVDVSSAMSEKEKGVVKDILVQARMNGATTFGEIDEDVVREEFDRDNWIEEHADTEARLIDQNIQSFTNWKEQHGYESQSSSEHSIKNVDAPHPDGGSLQLFIENLSQYGSTQTSDLRKFAVLDYAIGTMDRHRGNIMFNMGSPVAIDNGYSMPGSNTPDGFTFRSAPVGEWMELTSSSADIPSNARSKVRSIPEPMRTELLTRLNATDWQAFVARHPAMSDKERDAFLGRIGNLKTAMTTEQGLYELWQQQNTMGRYG